MKSIKDVGYREVKRYTTRCFPSQWSMRHPNSDWKVNKVCKDTKNLKMAVGVLDVNKNPLTDEYRRYKKNLQT